MPDNKDQSFEINQQLPDSADRAEAVAEMQSADHDSALHEVYIQAFDRPADLEQISLEILQEDLESVKQFIEINSENMQRNQFHALTAEVLAHHNQGSLLRSVRRYLEKVIKIRIALEARSPARQEYSDYSGRFPHVLPSEFETTASEDMMRQIYVRNFARTEDLDQITLDELHSDYVVLSSLLRLKTSSNNLQAKEQTTKMLQIQRLHDYVESLVNQRIAVEVEKFIVDFQRLPPTALFDDNEVAECDEDPMFIDVIDTDLTAEFDEEDQHCEEFEHDITVNQLIAGIYSPLQTEGISTENLLNQKEAYEFFYNAVVANPDQLILEPHILAAIRLRIAALEQVLQERDF